MASLIRSTSVSCQPGTPQTAPVEVYTGATSLAGSTLRRWQTRDAPLPRSPSASLSPAHHHHRGGAIVD
ncbi:hypothetical protein KCP71_11200 [Salmonella enterica subsp. enterica]|nr:hypothetical protein KCP71_11200 [Salmonella enterica subsp. enterica]